MANIFRILIRKMTLITFRYIHTRDKIQRIHILNIPFDVYPRVYNPEFSAVLKFPTTEHMAKNIHVNRGDRVLDVGTGIGVQAIVAALQGGSVVATDILQNAVICAKHNAQLNKVENLIDVRCGDLFDPVKNEKFDLILWLAPSFFEDPKHFYQKGWMCGKNGIVLENFCCEVNKYLKNNGRILFSCVDRNRDFILSRLESRGFHCKLVSPPKHRFPLETITLYEAKR